MVETAMTDHKALRDLLPELEQAGDRLYGEVYGLYIRAIFGDPKYEKFETRWWMGCGLTPDVDLSAADKLVMELLPGYQRQYSLSSSETIPARVRLTSWGEHTYAMHKNPCIAILIALVKALIAQAEQETADA